MKGCVSLILCYSVHILFSIADYFVNPEGFESGSENMEQPDSRGKEYTRHGEIQDIFA